MRRVRRDYPDFSKLAWMARRKGPRGEHALEVLQDALMIHFGPQLERAIQRADERQHELEEVGVRGFTLVVFHPEWEKTGRKRGAHHYPHEYPMGPFGVRQRLPPPGDRTVVVYDASSQFRVKRSPRP